MTTTWFILAEGATGAKSPFGGAEIFLVLLMLVVVFSMLWAARRKSNRPKFDREQFQRAEFSAMKSRQGVAGDLQELIIELEELSRRINAQIDTKFAKLEATIRHADERIEILRQLTQQAGGTGGLDVTVDDTTSESPAPGTLVSDPKRARVYALADADKSSIEIAQETGIPTGEIELILALRNQ